MPHSAEEDQPNLIEQEEKGPLICFLPFFSFYSSEAPYIVEN
jgi:hypothetical protein